MTYVKLGNMQVQQTVTISAKGQVVIPADVRQKYGWKPGMKVVVDEAKPMEIILRKKPKPVSLAKKYRGSMRGKAPSIKRYLVMKKEEIKLEE